MPRALVLVLALTGCGLYESPSSAPASAGSSAPVAESCVSRVLGPAPADDKLCSMAVSIAVTCAPGGSGRLVVQYGEQPSSTIDYAATFDAGYTCGVPVTATRAGIACDASVQAEARWWTPEGVELACVDYYASP